MLSGADAPSAPNKGLGALPYSAIQESASSALVVSGRWLSCASAPSLCKKTCLATWRGICGIEEEEDVVDERM